MRIRLAATIALSLIAITAHSASRSGDAVQARMDNDIADGNPLVAHVIVALCDNWYQRIVPVPAHLGDGNDPRSNLYWGAMYGVKTYFSRHKDWEILTIDVPPSDEILDRAAFRTMVQRENETVTAYIIAEAWRGRNIKDAMKRFLDLSGGHSPESVTVRKGANSEIIDAGGAAHLIAYVGHNGLMDFDAPEMSTVPQAASARSSIVLACKSQEYFDELISFNQSHSLLTTTGLMAPEAYSLEAAVSAWFSGESPSSTRDHAADEYARFQKANSAWARKLFATDE